MDFDIKKTAHELFEKISGDKELQEAFLKDPIHTLEQKLGIDLPDEQIKGVVEAIKAKLNLGKLGSVVESVEDAIGGLFKKK